MIHRVVGMGFVLLFARLATAQDTSDVWDFVPGTVLVGEPVVSGEVPPPLVSATRNELARYVSGPLGLKPINLSAFSRKKRLAIARTLRHVPSCPRGVCRDAAEVAAELRVETILVPDLAPTARGFMLTLTDFDGRTGVVVERVNRELLNPREIQEAAPDLAHLVFIRSPRDGLGYIRVDAVSGALIAVDGKTLGLAPLALPVRTTMGSHHVHAELRGFESYDCDVFVDPGKFATASVTFRNLVTGEPAPIIPKSDLPSLDQLAERSAVPAATAVAGPTTAVSAPARVSPKIGWTTGIVGVCALAVGIGLGAAASGHESHLKTTEQNGAAVASEVSTARTEAIGADVLFGVGGLLGATGVTLVVFF